MRGWRICLAAALAGLVPGAAAACGLALVLAVDVSGSVDREEYRIQMDGLAEALRDSVVSEALVQAQAQVLLLQWTGSSRQAVSVPWTALTGFDAVEALARQIETAPRLWRNYSTAVGEALGFALAQFDQVPDCARRVIDVSGDGPSNEGVEPKSLHARLRAAGVVVNALAIEESEPDLTAWFFENVLVGEGAFVITAAGFAEYPTAIRRKLLREVTKQTAAVTPQLRVPRDSGRLP